jgi:hypothetical protein
MTVDIYGRDHKKTFIILLLGANVLLLLAFFVQVTKQKEAADDIGKRMDAAIAGQGRQETLEQLVRQHEIVLRERLQARLLSEEEKARADGLADRVAGLEARTAELERSLAAAAAERDEHQSARAALERRLADALDLLTTHDELLAQAAAYEQVLVDLEQSRAEQSASRMENDRLRRRVLVLERLVSTLRRRN